MSADPLEPYVYIDDVPINTYDSPILTHPFFNTKTNDENDQTEFYKSEVQRMERKIQTFCVKGFKYEKRCPVGECPVKAFETYMSQSMPSHLYKRTEEVIQDFAKRESTEISFEFTFPHFPSFGNPTWTKHYRTIDMGEVAMDLQSLGAKIPEYFIQAPHRIIAKKLTITIDTKTEVYYVFLENWVQKKCSSDISECGFAWIPTFL